MAFFPNIDDFWALKPRDHIRYMLSPADKVNRVAEMRRNIYDAKVSGAENMHEAKIAGREAADITKIKAYEKAWTDYHLGKGPKPLNTVERAWGATVDKVWHKPRALGGKLALFGGLAAAVAGGVAIFSLSKTKKAGAQARAEMAEANETELAQPTSDVLTMEALQAQQPAPVAASLPVPGLGTATLDGVPVVTDGTKVAEVEARRSGTPLAKAGNPELAGVLKNHLLSGDLTADASMASRVAAKDASEYAGASKA